jgi:hypothetical protein
MYSLGSWKVLSESVALGELLENDAVTIVQNALFHNANKLYNLSLEPDMAIFERNERD